MNWIWLNYKGKNINFARKNRKLSTKCEWLVWNMILKNKNLWIKFLRQRMTWNYIVDFYCSKLKLVIEIDWESHNYKYNYDQKRKRYLQNLWLKVLIYTDEQVLNNLEWVFEDIKYHVCKSNNGIVSM